MVAILRSLTVLSLISLSTSHVVAEKISVPLSMFRTSEFKKEFVGSYGFLSPVEPKVSREESEQLVRVRELFDKGQFARAESELSRFIKAKDGSLDADGNEVKISPAMVFVLGTLYMQEDRLEDARRAYLESIRRYPDFRRAHTNLAYLYVRQEKLDKAMPHLQRALALGESTHRVYGLLGFGYLDQDNPVAAETAYRQAIMLDGQSRDWQFGLAQSLFQQEKFEEAAALLGSLIDENPSNKDLYLQQANAYLQMDKKMKAVANFEILRLQGMADEKDLNLLGNLYMDQDQPQLALFAYLAAIDKQTTFNSEVALKSALILNDYGYPEKAESLVQKLRRSGAADLSIDDKIELLLVEVRIAKSKEAFDEMGSHLTDLIDLAPANGEVLLEKGYYHEALAEQEDDEDARLAELREARTHFQMAADQADTAYQGNLALGQQHVRERHYIKGVEALKKAYDLKPNDKLKQFVNRVQRAADRQVLKEERLKKERAAK